MKSFSKFLLEWSNFLDEFVTDTFENLTDGPWSSYEGYWITGDAAERVPDVGSHDDLANAFFGGWFSDNPSGKILKRYFTKGLEDHVRKLESENRVFYYDFIAMLHGWIRLNLEFQKGKPNSSLTVSIELTNKRFDRKPHMNAIRVLKELRDVIERVNIDVKDADNPSKIVSKRFNDAASAIRYLRRV